MCGKTFSLKQNRIDMGMGKFCSRKCYFSTRTGPANNQWKGGPITYYCRTCGKPLAVYPSVLKRGKGTFCGRECYGKYRSEHLVGERSARWNGDATDENIRVRNSLEYKAWRETVFARDNWTCQDCGDNKGGNLNAHHIFPFADFPEHRLEVWNGITLCHPCHARMHPTLRREPLESDY